MQKGSRWLLAFSLFGALAVARPATGQTYEALGTRAMGMGGAFVAVADDASAVYWNPGGLAPGAFFSLVLDHSTSRAVPAGSTRAGSQSGTLLAAAVPALGVSYYRLRATRVGEAAIPAGRLDAPRNLEGLGTRVSSLITHHAGVTLVQSLTDYLSIGTTLKIVRGVAASEFVVPGQGEDLLDRAEDLVGAATNRFDADIGVMATLGTLRAGLAVRNVRESEFRVGGDTESVVLDRHVRAGVALTIATGVVVSADQDLVRLDGATGPVRNFAMGAEGRLTRRGVVRGGFRLNTLANQPGGRAATGTVGGSFAAWEALFVEGHASFGGDFADRGWGVGGRVVF